jgi:uncharacterized protein (TIGR00369 family)
MTFVPPGVTHYPEAYAPSFHKALRVQVGTGPDGEGVAWVELDREIHFGARWAHGGLVGALADIASGIAIARRFTEPMGVINGTIEMKVNFLRKATEGDLTASASVLRLGKRIAVTDVNVTTGGLLCAKALATFMLTDGAR